jgi:hypothetical protein
MQNFDPFIWDLLPLDFFDGTVLFVVFILGAIVLESLWSGHARRMNTDGSHDVE